MKASVFLLLYLPGCLLLGTAFHRLGASLRTAAEWSREPDIVPTTVMQEALGAEFVKLFMAVKRHEVDKAKAAIAVYDTPAFHDRVDAWEWNEYFEFL